MTTPKHTVAPWRFSNEFGRFAVIAPMQGLEIAQIKVTGDGEEDFDESEANAKLIAAAPDLLDALIGMISLYPFPASYNLKPAIEKANAAIAKATDE